MNLIDLIKEHRGVIIKGGLIAVGTAAGLAIAGKAILDKNHDDDDFEDYNENGNDEFDDSTEE